MHKDISVFLDSGDRLHMDQNLIKIMLTAQYLPSKGRFTQSNFWIQVFSDIVSPHRNIDSRH